MKTVLGVDIGMSGALAFYDGEEMLIWDMPIFVVKGCNTVDSHKLNKIIKDQSPTEVYIEQTIVPFNNSRKALMSLSLCKGIFVGILSSLEIPYTFISPRVWKTAMKCPAEKQAARMRATQLLPQHADNWPLKKHDGRAEAALIAVYGFNKCK